MPSFYWKPYQCQKPTCNLQRIHLDLSTQILFTYSISTECLSWILPCFSKMTLITKRLIFQMLHNSLIGLSQWLFSMEGQSKKNFSKKDRTSPDFFGKNKIVSKCWDIILMTMDNNSIKCNSNQKEQPLTSHFSVGFTIFPMKRMVWVYWSTINSKNGWLNLTMGGAE